MLRFTLRRLLTFPLLPFAIYAAAVLLIMAAPGEGLDRAGPQTGTRIARGLTSFPTSRSLAKLATRWEAI